MKSKQSRPPVGENRVWNVREGEPHQEPYERDDPSCDCTTDRGMGADVTPIPERSCHFSALRTKNWFAALVAAAAMTLTAGLAARLLLRHISLFLPFDDQFSTIFAQIHGAKLATPAVLLMILAFLAAWGLRKLRSCRGWRIPSAILWILLWVILFGMALYLTRVNGIRFGDVLVSLLEILEKGGLDGL